MKSITLFLFVSASILFFITSCKKESNTISLPSLQTDSVPYENNNLKIDFAADLPSKNVVTDMHFFDALDGIVITNAGEIYQTKNAGINWTLQYASPDSIYLYQLLFTNNNTGYVVGGTTSCIGNGCTPAGGQILKTNDGGNTWKVVLDKPDKEFVSISTNDNDELFAAANGIKNEIFRSADNGENWTSVTTSPFNFYKIIFNDGTGFCTTLSSQWLISKDDGVSWNVDSSSASKYSNDIEFKDGVGYCFSHLEVYKTTDNGDNWIDQGISGSSGFRIVKPLSANSCIVFGSGRFTGGDFGIFYGAIWQTVDGNDWNGVQFNNASIYAAGFYTSSNGYATSRDKLLTITVK
ncbi:MAG: hypothetical protein ABJB05_11340 [Parafilimonas sp.]